MTSSYEIIKVTLTILRFISIFKSMSKVSENIKIIKNRIDLAAKSSGRDSKTIKLVAVSKTKSSELIRAAFEAGQGIFGENYAQELARKASELSDLNIAWHFIGHLQRNKAKLIAPIVNCIETVDSVKLASEINRRAQRPIKILIEVNIADEKTKSGISSNEIPALLKELEQLENVLPIGLMVIPPYDENPESSRPYFKKLRELMTKLNEQAITKTNLTELSMGMSHDFEVAIEEGATIVRIGTAIFGERQTKMQGEAR